MTVYKLNGAAVEIVSRRSVNGRRWCKVRRADGVVEEVLYRELERERPDLTIVEVYKFTPKQWKLIKKGAASGRMKQFWIRQGRAH